MEIDYIAVKETTVKDHMGRDVKTGHVIWGSTKRDSQKLEVSNLYAHLVSFYYGRGATPENVPYYKYKHSFVLFAPEISDSQRTLYGKYLNDTTLSKDSAVITKQYVKDHLKKDLKNSGPFKIEIDTTLNGVISFSDLF